MTNTLTAEQEAAWARTDLPFRTHDTLNGGYKYGSLNVAAIWERQGCAVQHRSEASPLTNEPVGVTDEPLYKTVNGKLLERLWDAEEGVYYYGTRRT